MPGQGFEQEFDRQGFDRDAVNRHRRALIIAGGALIIGAALRPLGAAAQGKQRIGIIGSGHIGGTIGGLWVKAGHPVLVIDTLGAYVPAGAPGSTADLAWRLQRLQHDFDIDRLADAGIPVVAWRGAGSLNTVLLKLSRAASAPRLVR